MNLAVKALVLILCLIASLNVVFSCPGSCICKSSKHLVCKHKSLTSIPVDIPNGVTYLDLSSNDIKNLSADLFIHFPLLKTLKLNNNKMKSIDESAFRGLSNLRELFLVQNDLSVLAPNTFKDLNKLLHVYLGNNEFESIPVLKATQMTKLNLDSNQIKSAFIDKSFLLNTGLKTIVLTKNHIKNITKTDFLNLKNTQLISIMLKFNALENIDLEAFAPVKEYLQNLELEGNRLLNSSKLENALKSFKGGGVAMLYLDLKDCGLTSISGTFFEPFTNSKLHQLDISHNSQLRLVDDDAFDGLTNLQLLKMSNCKIASSTIRFSALHRLRQLDMSHNNLTRCPNRLPGSLETIDLQSNDIRKIAKDDFKSLTELKQLNLRNNAILSIEADSFIDLNQLTALDLSFNRLKHIETSIFIAMPSLVRLDLRKQNPCIATVEPNAFVLANLQSLNLDGNCIAFQQSGTGLFGGLPLLANLSLAENRLVDLPGSLFVGCRSLKNVDLSRNHLRGWSPETFVNVKKTVESIQLGFNQIASVAIDPAGRNYFPTDFVALRTVGLDNNIWNCTCANVSWLVRYQSVLVNRDKIICHVPNDKTGRRLLLLMTSCSPQAPMVEDYAHTGHAAFYIASWVIRLCVVAVIMGVATFVCRMAWKFRRRIFHKYRQWTRHRNLYTSIENLNNSTNGGYTNDCMPDDDEQDDLTNRLVIDVPCDINVPSIPTWQQRLANAPIDEEMEAIDIVLVTREIHPSLVGIDGISVYQITDLSTDQMKIKVHQCAKLAIDYPPPNPNELRAILDMRTGHRTNYLLLTDDNDNELDGAGLFHSKFRWPIRRYDSSNLRNTLLKIA